MTDFNSITEDRTEPQAQVAISSAASTALETSTNPASPEAGTSATFAISEYKNRKDNVPKAKTHTWGSFTKEFSAHLSSREKDGPGWSPVSFTDKSTRGNDNVKEIFLAVLDIDDGTPVDMMMQRISGYACLVHSSYSHTTEKPKYRVVIPFERPVALNEWPYVWPRINLLVGKCIDPATKDPARLFYKPAHPVGTNDHFVHVQEGRPICIEDLPELSSDVVVQPLVFHPRGTGKHIVEIEGIESNGPELNFEQGLNEVVNRCEFMRFSSAPENQENISEPLWMAMITNACRFENSEAWIHAASEHYSGYDEHDTDARIERYRNNSGPVTCQRIRDLAFPHCPSGGCRKPNGEETKAPAGLHGWMFQRQLTAAETATNQIPEKYTIGEFSVDADGVYQAFTKDDEVTHLRLCSRIDVTALTRDPDSSNWGMELRFTDPDHVTKNWALPKELLASVGDSYRGSLLKMGASIEPGKKGREGLAAYLNAAMPEARALSVKQPGWSDGVFVLPNGVYGRSEQRVVFQTTDPDDIERFSQKGSLESWQQNVAALCQGNSRAAASICIGLAPPLLSLLGEDNGGFHLRGITSIGKSICLNLGSSVWGSKTLIRTWNMTVNGLEGVAVMHNDVLLPLDELGQADGNAAGEAAYLLGNGQGKSRAGRDGAARTTKRFRNLVLSSGEKSMADLMAQAGQTVMAGQEVRMVEIAADAGCGFGVFENIYEAKSSQVFAESLKRAISQHHGHAGRAFVELLANPDLQPKLIERIKVLIQRFVDINVPIEASGQVGRVGRRFGLVAAAGELCIELGILPWPEGEAFEACRKCFEAWIEVRGGIGNHETEQAIAKVRRFIELHGDSRFTSMQAGFEDNGGLGKTIQRAGFRQVINDGRTEFFILPEVYRTEICAGLNPKYVTSVLVEKGFMTTDSKGVAQIEKSLPGMGKKRVYHLTADFMDDGFSRSEIHEKVVRSVRVTAMAANYSV